MTRNLLISILIALIILSNLTIGADNLDLGEGYKPGEFTNILDKSDFNPNAVNWNTVPLWEMRWDQILKFFDKIPENRFDELDDDELEEALEQKYNLDNMDIDLGSNTNDVEFLPDSFYFDNAQYLGIGTTIINNGKNVRYKQGNLTAEHADLLLKTAQFLLMLMTLMLENYSFI